MRTTLSIDDDVLAAARAIAAAQRKSVGKVISALSRAALKPEHARNAAVRNGIRLLPVSTASEPVMMQLVNRLRDDLP